jgi:hypothetical protein
MGSFLSVFATKEAKRFKLKVGVFEFIRHALQCIQKGEYFSEFGFV